MKDPYQIILKPLITEKSTILRDRYVERPGGKKDLPKYAFVVDTRASKPEIRQAAEEWSRDLRVSVSLRRIRVARSGGNAVWHSCDHDQRECDAGGSW